jgi:hypothetical protein
MQFGPTSNITACVQNFFCQALKEIPKSQACGAGWQGANREKETAAPEEVEPGR